MAAPAADASGKRFSHTRGRGDIGSEGAARGMLFVPCALPRVPASRGALPKQELNLK